MEQDGTGCMDEGMDAWLVGRAGRVDGSVHWLWLVYPSWVIAEGMSDEEMQLESCRVSWPQHLSI